jgi:hypothetical protein
MPTEATTSDVETETAASEVADTSADDQIETESTDEEVEGDDTDADDQSDSEDDGLEEVEWEGKKARLPPEFKSALMRTQDYTQKTQALSEDRKALEAARTAALNEVQTRLAIVDDQVKLKAVEQELAEYAKLSDEDWAKVKEADPDAYRDHKDQLRDLRDARDKLNGELKTKLEQHALEDQRTRVTAIQEGYKKLPTIIPGWNSDTEAKTVAFAKAQGFDDDDLRDALADPRRMKMLHLARLGEESLAQKKATARITAGQKTTPAKTVGGATPNARRTTDASGDGLSTEEWARREEARLAAKRKQA